MNYYIREVRKSVSSAWLWVLSIIGAFGFLSAFNHVYEFDYFLELATRLNWLSEFIWIRLLNIDVPNLVAEHLTILVLSIFLFLRGLLARADPATRWIKHLPTRDDERNFRITLACFIALLVVVFFYVFEQIWSAAGVEAGLSQPAEITQERVLITASALVLVSVSFLLLFYYPRILLSAALAGAILVGVDRVLDDFAEDVLIDNDFGRLGAEIALDQENDPLAASPVLRGYIGGQVADGRFYTTTNARMRTAPGLDTQTVRVLRRGRAVQVRGVSPDDRWAAVVAEDLDGPNRGWVHVTLLRK